VAGEADWLAGGRVGRPHGLDGSFHVVAPRAALLVLGATVRAGGREAEIVRRAGTDERPIVRLEGVGSREAAEALRGTELLVPRAVAPALEEDEWWAEDLEGCRVVDGARELGRVVRLVALPSCEALEVASGAAAEPFLVPMVRDAVRRVDVGAQLIDVDVAFLGDTVPESVAAPESAAAPELGEAPESAAAPELGEAPESAAAPEPGEASRPAEAPEPAAPRETAPARPGPAAARDTAPDAAPEAR
jgi:16S rRNA processing protein RimM